MTKRKVRPPVWSKVIGQAVSMPAAIALADHYVGAWLESDAAAAELCRCTEIGASP